MSSAAARLEVLPGGRSDTEPTGDTDWLTASPGTADEAGAWAGRGRARAGSACTRRAAAQAARSTRR